MDHDPVASLEVLKREGMDISKFGSCSRQEKEGREMINMGCKHHRRCQWANESMPDIEVDGEKVEGGLRPKNKRYVLVKPSEGGRRKIKEGWCSCFEFHENFGRLHGKNGVVCKVTGGEGDKYRARGSKKIPATSKDEEPRWEPVFWSAEVPVFKPEQKHELVEERYANAILKESGMADDDDAIKAAISGDDGAKDITSEISDEEVRNILGKRGTEPPG